LEAYTDSEVFQEILYRYYHISQLDSVMLNSGIDTIATTGRAFSRIDTIKVYSPLNKRWETKG